MVNDPRVKSRRYADLGLKIAWKFRCKALDRQVLDRLAPRQSNLPELSEAHPTMPRTAPLAESKIVAANLRTQFWKRGVGYNEVAEELKLSKSIMYDIMNGSRQTTEAVGKLAGYFKVTPDQLRDPHASRYDTTLVINNVCLLVKQFGTCQLPCPETVTNVVEKRHLPPGNVLARLAEAVDVALEEFLTQDVSARANLQLRPTWRKPPSQPIDVAAEALKQRNFAANLRLLILLAGMSGACEAAKALGTTRTQMMNYVSERCFPPEDILEKIVTYFNPNSDAGAAVLRQRIGAQGFEPPRQYYNLIQPSSAQSPEPPIAAQSHPLPLRSSGSKRLERPFSAPHRTWTLQPRGSVSVICWQKLDSPRQPLVQKWDLACRSSSRSRAAKSYPMAINCAVLLTFSKSLPRRSSD